MPWKEGDIKLLIELMVESGILSIRKKRKELYGFETGCLNSSAHSIIYENHRGKKFSWRGGEMGIT